MHSIFSFFGSFIELFLFFGMITLFIAFDFLFAPTKPHLKRSSLKKDLLFSLGWILIALLFNCYIWYTKGDQSALEFLTGYVIEKSLSIDNLFVFILIFQSFRIPTPLQHRVLYYGVIGAIFFRLIMIFLGIELIQNFTWIIYIFGAFLIYAGIKAFDTRNTKAIESQPEKHPALLFLQKYIPVTETFHDDHFFIRIPKNIRTPEKSRWAMTPLFMALITIELTDIIFAVDSIPAILAITQDPYIVLTSNIFAMLGLRSLYFVLEPLLDLFYLLQYAVGIILIFVGIKFLITPFYHIPIFISLLFIIITVVLALILSFFSKNK